MREMAAHHDDGLRAGKDLAGDAAGAAVGLDLGVGLVHRAPPLRAAAAEVDRESILLSEEF